MVIEKLRRDYYFSVLIFILVESFFVLVFAFISIAYSGLFSEGLIVLILGSIGFWYLTISKIRNRYKRFMNLHFKVTSLEHKLNYPTYFKKAVRIPLFIWDKAYLCKKVIIPKRFIGFVEGRFAYPIKELDEFQINNHYEILYIHRGYAALIQDMDHKKYLIHLDNLEPIE